MKTQNLILTSTVGMNREEWLSFRRPITHVTKFLEGWYKRQSDPAGFPVFFLKSPAAYEFLKYVFNTQEWKDFIFPVIGASEIASVVGLHKYKSIIELYYEKVGLKDDQMETNDAMFWGKELECQIAEKWQYWEGSSESMIRNYEARNIIRRCRRINAYAQNKKTPWMFVSLDRIINHAGEKKEGSLECKCISAWAANMWEHNIPPMYVCQLQAQLGTFEFEHGEIAILKDGREFEVYPFDENKNIIERLEMESFKFHAMVKSGMEEYLLSRCAPEELKLTHLSNVDKFSPEPDGSLAYESYLKGAYTEAGYEVPGGLQELALAKAYKFFDVQGKAIKDKQRECANRLRAFMKDAARIDFGLDGNVTWKANAKGDRVLRINVQPEEPADELIKTEELPEQLQENP